MKQTVAAVVVTHNRKELLVRCLRAILDQTYAVDRIFVVDNASSDGTPQKLCVTSQTIIRPSMESSGLDLNQSSTA